MFNELIVEQLEADLVTSFDIHISLRSGARSALVAPEIIPISLSVPDIERDKSTRGGTDELIISVKEGM